MAKMVLDASALLAFVNREPGAEKVTAVLGEAMISAVNLCEVVTKLALRGSAPRRILAALAELNSKSSTSIATLPRRRGCSPSTRAAEVCRSVTAYVLRWRGAKVRRH